MILLRFQLLVVQDHQNQKVFGTNRAQSACEI